MSALIRASVCASAQLNNPPRLLDLFCGAGGAAMGYRRAGFEVVGVDIEPQPRYPFEFHQADALTFSLAGYDAIHASPPCQAFIRSGMYDKSPYRDSLTPIRARLQAQTAPWIIENVPGAPMRPDVVLCGSAFGLGSGRWQLRRHRWFEAGGWTLAPWTLSCHHDKPAIGVYGHARGANAKWGGGTLPGWRESMGIDWMNEAELGEAIPPAYTEWIGGQLMHYLETRREAA